MKTYSILFLLIQSFLLGSSVCRGAVIFDQPPSPTSTLSHVSATGTVCTAHYQQRIWESFVFSTAQTIREIQWRGTYGSLPPAQFIVQIYNPLPSGHSYLNERPAAFFITAGNADETPAGSVGGVPMYSYRFALPTPFNAFANQNYALQIFAFQPGVPDWGFQTSSTGGGHTALRGAIELLQDSTYGGAAGRSALSFLDQVTNPNAVITLAKSPAAGGTVTGSGTFAPGTSVTVTATPAANYTFLYWKQGINTVSTSASYTFTAGAYRALVAHFGSPNVARINATAFPPIAGHPSGGGTFTVGQQVEIDVSVQDGFLFAGWYENDAIASTVTPYLFDASTDRNLEARFFVSRAGDSTAVYTIVRVRAEPPGSSIVTGEGAWVGYSRNVYISATPGENYRFNSWWQSAAFQISTTANTSYNASIGYNWFYARSTPEAAISAAPGGLRVKWPNTAPGWLLQESPDLSAGSWSATNRPISLMGGQNTVTAPTLESQRFFRLFHP